MRQANKYYYVWPYNNSTLIFIVPLGVPSNPTNVIISEKIYGYESSNATLLWTSPAIGKITNYNIKLILMDRIHQMYQVNRAMIHANVPYNEDITASITAENCFGESGELNFTFTICK